MIDELSVKIWNQPKFHAESRDLHQKLLQGRYIGVGGADFDDRALVRLLKSAAILAASSNQDFRKEAYKIATAASELEFERFPGVANLLLLVLSRIGNFPAILYAKKKFLIQDPELPARTIAEVDFREAANTVKWGDQSVSLTDFQLKLWGDLLSGQSVGISAPTSAGKSFIFQAYARSMFFGGLSGNMVFLVPTRALINQVSDDAADWIRKIGLGIELITTPVPRDSALPVKAVYVLTQERLQLLQADHPGLNFDVMLVDEIQSIGDGHRGVLLSSVIDEALKRNPALQLLFAGPNIRNPQSIPKLFGLDARVSSTSEAAVVQNLIFVDSIPEKPSAAKLSIRYDGQSVALGEILCDQPLVDHRSKLVNLTRRLGGGGQNLIYALGPKECEDIVFGLSDDMLVLNSPELNGLSEFIRDAVHPKYQLAFSVLKGVGFHYGRLPSLVRKAIEDAFSSGHLRYLVTTSTLLYGVNLPAQNLFLHTPQKGQGQPLSSIDFWNLAGRAGRLGKEFTGNVFLIDYKDWNSNPIDGEKEQDVKPAIVNHVSDRAEELLAYVLDKDRIPDRRKGDEMEVTFVKLVSDYFGGTLEATFDRAGLERDNPLRLQLAQGISSAVEGIDIDGDTLSTSPSVSVHRQQALYDWLTISLKKKGAAYIIPRHPLHQDAYTSYLAAIKRCHGAILKYPKSDVSHRYFAQIALRWMRGESLPQIIDAAYANKSKNNAGINMASVIREALNDIERELRFKYVRLFSCYNAVLALVLRNNGLVDLIPGIPSIPMYLEVGACSPTMISFMGIGLSRYTAAKLAGFPNRKDMTQVEARAWILRQQIDVLDLPRASRDEIRRVVG
jgi:hypothetical protein